MASENDTNDNLANENVIKEKVIKIEDADKFIKAKEKEKRTNNAYLFGKAFGERLRTDKMFLLSFFITLIFLCALSYRTLKNSESSYPGIFKNIMKTSEQSSSNDSDSKSSVHVNETLDISDKVGVYSREVNLTDKLVLSDSCSIDTYKYVYQIKKDKTITKYLYNSCLGAIKVWEDKLDYVLNKLEKQNDTIENSNENTMENESIDEINTYEETSPKGFHAEAGYNTSINSGQSIKNGGKGTK